MSRMYLGFGMAVMASDGSRVGALRRALVDPQNREITHILVQTPGQAEDILVPLNLVQGNVGDHLELRFSRDDLSNLPRYDEERADAPPSGRVDVEHVRQPNERREELESALALHGRTFEYGPNTRIVSRDGAGRLVGLATDAYTNCLSGLRVYGPGDVARTVGEHRIGRLLIDAVEVAD